MSQQQIIDYLKKNKGKLYSAQDIALHLNIKENSIWSNLNHLRQSFYGVNTREIPTVIYVNKEVASNKGVQWVVVERWNKKKKACSIKIMYYYDE